MKATNNKSYNVQVMVDGQVIYNGPIKANSKEQAHKLATSRVPLSVSENRIQVEVLS